MNELNELLDCFESAKDDLDFLENEYEKDSENIDLRVRCEKAYEVYYDIAQEVANKVACITSGKINFRKARQIAYQNPEELRKYC